MIAGAVDANLEVRIPLFLEDDFGQSHPIEGVVDTGFSAFLSLPTAFITSLALPWLVEEEVILANGRIESLDTFAATIIWDGQPRSIRVYAVDTDPLVGMKLLAGNEVRIRVVAGGVVWIDALP